MDRNLILYPGVAMFFLTFAMVIRLGMLRVSAVRRREVSIRFYRLYNEGEQPEPLQLISRHVQNHFEVPPLFYAVLGFTWMAGQVSALTVGLAWLYVLSRCVHSFIHLGSNDVTHRLIAYATGGLILAALWLCLLVAMATGAA